MMRRNFESKLGSGEWKDVSPRGPLLDFLDFMDENAVLSLTYPDGITRSWRVKP